jgi:hypothetical protein
MEHVTIGGRITEGWFFAMELGIDCHAVYEEFAGAEFYWFGVFYVAAGGTYG